MPKVFFYIAAMERLTVYDVLPYWQVIGHGDVGSWTY